MNALSAIFESLPQLGEAFLLTALLWVCALVLGMIGGTLILLGRTFGPKWLTLMLSGYTNLFRSVPLVMVLLFYYLALPDFFGKTFTAILAFAFFESAYFAEILRSGLNTLPISQKEAALNLGLSKFQTFRLVLLPQAIKASMKSLGNQAVVLFQDTSLVYVIGLSDFFTSANRQGQQTGQITALIMFAGIVYLTVSIVAAKTASKITKIKETK